MTRSLTLIGGGPHQLANSNHRVVVVTSRGRRMTSQSAAAAEPRRDGDLIRVDKSESKMARTGRAAVDRWQIIGYRRLSDSVRRAPARRLVLLLQLLHPATAAAAAVEMCRRRITDSRSSAETFMMETNSHGDYYQ